MKKKYNSPKITTHNIDSTINLFMEKQFVKPEINNYLKNKYPYIFKDKISYEELINWLRDELNLHITINYVNKILKYSYSILQVEDNEVIFDNIVKKRKYNEIGWDFYQAREEAINKCVEFLK